MSHWEGCHSFHVLDSQQRRRAALIERCIRVVQIVTQFSPEIPWKLQQVLLWLQASGTVFGLYVFHHTPSSLHPLLLKYSVPLELPWDWYFRPSIVYWRFSLKHTAFYIGSTSQDAFLREQSRLRKYRQLCQDVAAYFEPALQYWRRTKSFFQFSILPLCQEESAVLAAAESSMQ